VVSCSFCELEEGSELCIGADSFLCNYSEFLQSSGDSFYFLGILTVILELLHSSCPRANNISSGSTVTLITEWENTAISLKLLMCKSVCRYVMILRKVLTVSSFSEAREPLIATRWLMQKWCTNSHNKTYYFGVKSSFRFPKVPYGTNATTAPTKVCHSGF
jgi:hypothetical protein